MNYCGIFCTETFDPKWKRVFSTCVLCSQFVLPLIVITSCYTSIFRRLRRVMCLLLSSFANVLPLQGMITGKCRSTPASSAANGGAHTMYVASIDRRKRQAQRRYRTNIMLVMMVVVFVTCWLPNQIYWLCYDYSVFPDNSFFLNQVRHSSACFRSYANLLQIPFCTLMAHCVAMTSTVWNPVLYAALNEQLRQGAIECLPLCIQNRIMSLRFILHLSVDNKFNTADLSTR